MERRVCQRSVPVDREFEETNITSFDNQLSHDALVTSGCEQTLRKEE